MKNCSKNSITFDSKYNDCITTFLYSKSLSRKRILISEKAYQYPTKTITKYYFFCKIKKSENNITLTWKTCLSPTAIFGVCCLIILYAASLIALFVKRTQSVWSHILFLILFTSLVLFVVAYYYLQYRSCKKQFISKINAITNQDKYDPLPVANQGTVDAKKTSPR